jgi:uncharacterized delta-60 repeat protein/uncharacterized repeat protein (TIGR01451 family)
MRKIIIAVLFLSAAFPSLAYSQYYAGDLDVSFDADGKVLHYINLGDDAASDLGKAYAVAVQPDGFILVAGVAGHDGNKMVLLRLTPVGALDGTFSGNGVALVPPLDPPGQAFDLALQTDGKILVGGTTNPGTSGDFNLARFNPDGSFDAGFGLGGIVMTDFGGDDWGKSIALQPDGKIVMVGFDSYAPHGHHFAIVRYDSNGFLDTSFSADGKTTIDLGHEDFANAVAILPDGKILIGGDSGHDFGIARLNSDGSLDTSFNGDGMTTIDFGGVDVAQSMAIQADGKIVLAGNSYDPAVPPPYRYIALARLNSDGTADTTFDGDGKVLTDVSPNDDVANSVVLQSDGKILVGGSAAGDFVVARYLPTNGSLDFSFGNCGIVATDFSGRIDTAESIALGPDNKIVLAGESCHPDAPWQSDFAIARYLSEPPRPYFPMQCSSVSISTDVLESEAPLDQTDLQVAMTDSPDPVYVNRELTYTVQVSNLGPDHANVVLENSLPSGATFIRSSHVCSVNASLLTCDLGTLSSGSSVTVTVVLKPTVKGTLNNTVSVRSGITDTNATNNSASASTTVRSLWWQGPAVKAF